MAAEAFTFIVPGLEETPGGAATRDGEAPLSLRPAGFEKGSITRSVRVGAQRGEGGAVRLTAVAGQDAVLVQLANGPTLVLHPESARDLMLAQTGGARDEPPDRKAKEVVVPPQLRWRGLEEAATARGVSRDLGDVLVSLVHVFTGPAAGLAAREIEARVDGQVVEGVYRLDPKELRPLKDSTRLPSIPEAADGKPILVFIHGTFSTTEGTFGKLWTEHPALVRKLFERYAGRVYALDHRTLGASPIANALTLAEALPAGATVHLVTHSRGGLVAETLARAAGAQFGARDLEFFKGEDYVQHRADLEKLAAKAKGINVERVVRVACPARGTLLASKRLDAYLSVFKWGLELAGVPVLPEVVSFLAEVAQHRKSPKEFAGLAAQIPDSPLVQWLHAAEEPIPGELRVVAGDLEGDSVLSWLKTLLSDSFYRTDNDLVVQTSSMYGGASRGKGASFVLDQGGNVSHFCYFRNERTANAIVDALTEPAPSGFQAIGPASWAGKSTSGWRDEIPVSHLPPAEMPAVFLLPGIMGSNLRIGDERIWLGLRMIGGLGRLAYQAGGADNILPDGPIGRFYDRLAEFLARTHEVIKFAFDWRRPIEEEAARLAGAVEKALDARKDSRQPVRMIAHSMGGLVARVMQIERDEVWQRMMAVPGARVLMLGTPNAGSWTPMQVLSGDDSLSVLLSDIGAPFQDHKARQWMAEMPGLIQLQAGLTDPGLKLDQEATWRELARKDLEAVRIANSWHNDGIQERENEWGVPKQAVLDQAKKLRLALDAQAVASEKLLPQNLLLVTGNADTTPDGYNVDAHGALVYLNAAAGDGRVTLAGARLPGVRAWKVDCAHGDLASEEGAFEAYAELLSKGNTDRLQPADDVPREAAAAIRVPSRPSRMPVAPPPPRDEREALAAQPRAQQPAAALSAALRVSVVNGDLSFVLPPLLLGHYRAARLTGTEDVMDQLLDGEMSRALQVDNYPDAPGSNHVFLNLRNDPENPWQVPRPQAVVIVGLGEEGKLRANDLAKTVRHGVLTWAQRLHEKDPGGPPQFELAATLIGSGGQGVSPGQSAQLVARGVREANERLASLEQRWPTVSRLHLIEVYLDRASEALRALQIQAAAAPAFYSIDPAVEERTGSGALPRPPDLGYRGTNYDFMTALTRKEEGKDEAIQYTLDTRRAGTEVRTQQAQARLVRELVRVAASRDSVSDRNIGRTLFNLLVPLDLEPFLGGTAEMVLELDSGTAGIPWELLQAPDEGGGDRRPWAIRAKLLRRLRIDALRPQITDASKDASVLVVGEPKCPDNYPRLPGARREAIAVAATLTAPEALSPERVKTLIAPENPNLFGATSRTVVETLHSQPWRIVHICGHGEKPQPVGPAPQKPGDPPQKLQPGRGVVLSDGIFLGQAEIRAMRQVPELVFVNCCHLAATDSQGVMDYSRPEFAASVAEALIGIGVRCVIAAGWAVDDAVAEEFSKRFYEALLRGERFMDAVADARDSARARGGNTWAAYQCYGDPNWRFQRAGADAQAPAPALGAEFAAVSSADALELALQTLAVRSAQKQKSPAGETKEQADARKEARLDKLRFLESTYAGRWGKLGSVAEAFGRAWQAAGVPAKAIQWYTDAVNASDGSASFKAAEQLGNVQARMAEGEVAAKRKSVGAGAALRSFVEKKADECAAALASLKRLADMRPTMETLSLCASACKRLAMIREAGGLSTGEAMREMADYYLRAEQAGAAAGLADTWYPALNGMAAELTMRNGKGKRKPLDEKLIGRVRSSIAEKLKRDPDFWSYVAQTELKVYEAVATGRLAERRAAIAQAYADVHARVAAPWLWSSVADQARLVLGTYQKGNTAAECEAAARLIEQVESYATGAQVKPGPAAAAPSEPPQPPPTVAAIKKKRTDSRRKSA